VEYSNERVAYRFGDVDRVVCETVVDAALPVEFRFLVGDTCSRESGEDICAQWCFHPGRPLGRRMRVKRPSAFPYLMNFFVFLRPNLSLKR
jgi:hypothetical protein